MEQHQANEEDEIDNKKLLNDFSTKISEDFSDINPISILINMNIKTYHTKMKNLLNNLKKYISDTNHILLRNQYSIFDYKIILHILNNYIYNINLLLYKLSEDIDILLINRILLKKECSKTKYTEIITDFKKLYKYLYIYIKSLNNDLNELNKYPNIIYYVIKDIQDIKCKFNIIKLQLQLYDTNLKSILNYIYFNKELYKLTEGIIKTYTNDNPNPSIK